MDLMPGVQILIAGNPHIVVHVGVQWGAIDPGTGFAWNHMLYADRSAFSRMIRALGDDVQLLQSSSTGRG